MEVFLIALACWLALMLIEWLVTLLIPMKYHTFKMDIFTALDSIPFYQIFFYTICEEIIFRLPILLIVIISPNSVFVWIVALISALWFSLRRFQFIKRLVLKKSILENTLIENHIEKFVVKMKYLLMQINATALLNDFKEGGGRLFEKLEKEAAKMRRTCYIKVGLTIFVQGLAYSLTVIFWGWAGLIAATLAHIVYNTCTLVIVEKPDLLKMTKFPQDK